MTITLQQARQVLYRNPPSPCVGGGYMSTVQRIHGNAEEGEMRFLHEFIAFADD